MRTLSNLAHFILKQRQLDGMSEGRSDVKTELEAWSNRFDADGKLVNFTFSLPPRKPKTRQSLHVSNFAVSLPSPKPEPARKTPRPWNTYGGNWD